MNPAPDSGTQSRTSPRSRVWRRLLTAGGVLTLLVCGGCGYQLYRFLSPVPIEVSPGTTVLDGPLLPDGRVDYVSALNERMSEGVTPDNNAAVLLMQAFGPEIIEAEHRAEFFERLGIPEPPPDGNYATDPSSWVRRETSSNSQFATEWAVLRDQFDAACSRPWTPSEFPRVAECLKDNEAALELIVAATTRPRLYSPLYSSQNPPLLAAPQPLQMESWTAAQLLCIRAMLRIGDGDIAGAWRNLLACHRLARLIGTGEGLMDAWMSFGCSFRACEASVSLAQAEPLSAEQARRFLADLEALPALPGAAATIDVSDRFIVLDTIQSMARGDAGEASSDVEFLHGLDLDWNLMLRLTNERFDDIVAAARQETYRERIEMLEPLLAEMDSARAAAARSPRMLVPPLTEDRQQVTRHAATAIIQMMTSPDDLLLNETRAEARLRQLRIAFMLAAYRAERGAYPEALDELSPDYLTEIPLDPFLDEPFHYERTATGYRLYSVGDNMIDDGGRTYSSEPYGDDILVETPATDQAAE